MNISSNFRSKDALNSLHTLLNANNVESCKKLINDLSLLWAVQADKVDFSNAPIKSKLQHPPPPPPPGQTPGIWLFSVPGEWGIWRIRPSRGWGIWPCLGGVEKIEPEVSGFKIFFFRAPKSLTAININTCLDEMEEFEGRDIAFVSDWLTKKGLQKWECLNINDFCRLYIKDVDFLYNESRCGFVPRLCLQRFLE